MYPYMYNYICCLGCFGILLICRLPVAQFLRLGDGPAAAVGGLGDQSFQLQLRMMSLRLSALAPSGDPEVRKLVREVLQDMACRILQLWCLGHVRSSIQSANFCKQQSYQHKIMLDEYQKTTLLFCTRGKGSPQELAAHLQLT